MNESNIELGKKYYHASVPKGDWYVVPTRFIEGGFKAIPYDSVDESTYGPSGWEEWIPEEPISDEERENWRRVHYRKDKEGFHYCFDSYSNWPEIDDRAFHRLRKLYLYAAERLNDYIEKKHNESNEY